MNQKYKSKLIALLIALKVHKPEEAAELTEDDLVWIGEQIAAMAEHGAALLQVKFPDASKD